MFYDRGFTLFRKGINFIEAERFSGLYKILKFVTTSFLSYKKLVIYETDLTKIPDVDTTQTGIENVELRIISGEDHLSSLMKDGYDFSFYPNIKVDKYKFKLGARLVAVFVNRELVYKNWLALSKESAFALGPFLKNMDYADQAIGDSAETNPQYRGKGIFQYAIANNLTYAKRMGKSSLLTYVYVDNLISRKAQEKSGLNITHAGFHFRFLYLWDIYRVHPWRSNNRADN